MLQNSAAMPGTAAALLTRRKRREEEMRQAEESARKAAALNAAEEARKVQNWRIGRQTRQARQAAQPLDDALEDEEKAFQAYKPVRKPQTPRPVVPGYASYRAGERAGYAAGQAQRRPWWQRAGERIKTGVNAFNNLAAAIGAVEIARRAHFLKDTPPNSKIGSSLQSLWGSMSYQAEKWSYGWEKVQAKMDDVRGRTAVAIQRGIENGQGWQAEMKAHGSSISGQARMTWDALRRNGLDGLKVKRGSLVDFGGSTSNIASAIGYAGYAVTGNEGWRTTGQWADAASVPAAVRQVATNLKPAAQFFTNGPISKGVSLLGKVAGPLAVVTGVITAIPGTIGAIKDFQEGDNRMGWANTLSAISGVAAVVGGVALLIPGAQPVAAVALGVSAITGVASMAVEYWPTPTGATTPVDTSLRPPVPPACTPTPTGTPTPTPQSTPTPAPTQNASGGK